VVHFSVRHQVTTSLGTQSSDLWVIWRITFLSSDMRRQWGCYYSGK